MSGADEAYSCSNSDCDYEGERRPLQDATINYLCPQCGYALDPGLPSKKDESEPDSLWQ
jgi:hypothetical protein